MLGVGSILAGFLAKATIKGVALKGAFMASPLSMLANKYVIGALASIFILGYTFHQGRVFEANKIKSHMASLNKTLAKQAERDASEDATESMRTRLALQREIERLRNRPAESGCNVPPSVITTIKDIVR